MELQAGDKALVFMQDHNCNLIKISLCSSFTEKEKWLWCDPIQI